MRPPQKNRNNRSKGGRNKPVGNVQNRVYESAGPEGKVRGTPQQIIEKYQHLARDAQTSGDRVTAENFLQHAEHYVRLLSVAQAQAEERRAQQQVNGGGQQRTDGDDQSDDDDDGFDRSGYAHQAPSQDRQQPREAAPRRDEQRGGEGREDRGRRDGGEQRRGGDDERRRPAPAQGLETFDAGEGDGEGLVATPESRAEVKPRDDRPREGAPHVGPREERSQEAAEEKSGQTAETEAEKPAEPRRRRRRAPATTSQQAAADETTTDEAQAN